jgi:hypothetical protein
MLFDKTRFSMGVRGRSSVNQVFKGEKGSALITVLIVMGVLTVLGAALLHYSLTDNLQVINDEKRMQAHYLARSGAEAVADYIMKNPDGVDELLGKKTEPVELGEGTFQVEVTKKDNGELLIESKGEVDDFIRTVKLTMVPYGLGDFAIFCNSSVSTENNFEVWGDIGSNSATGGSITFDNNAEIHGDILVGPGGDPDEVVIFKKRSKIVQDGKVGRLDSQIQYQEPKFPGFPNLDPKNDIILSGTNKDEIDKDGYYEKITLSKSSELSIDVKSVVRKIVVDELIIENSGKIIIKGEGDLKLYIGKSLMMVNNGNIFTGEDEKKVTIYCKEDSNINIMNKTEFYGTLFLDCASFNVTNSAKIHGNIIATKTLEKMEFCNSFTLIGAIYAPKSEIVFNNNCTITGLVIADSIKSYNKFNIVYDNQILDFPYEDFEINSGFRKGIWSN